MLQRLEQVEPRSLALAGSGVLLLLATALFFNGLMPKIKILHELSTTQDILLQAASSVDPGADLSRLREEVTALNKKLHGDTANRPVKEMESFVIGRLQRISWQNNVELGGVVPKEGEDFQSFLEILFEVELTGDYFDLFSWIKDVGEQLGFVVVKRYLMEPVATDDGETLLHVKLSMAVYRTKM